MTQEMEQDFLNKQFESPSEDFGFSDGYYEDIIIGTKRMFRCLEPDCGKTFRYRSEMLRHITIHSSKKSYTCTYPDCYKSFKRADSLKSHFKTHKTIASYTCHYPNCNLKFISKASLNYHKLKHGEKNFICSFTGCNKAFTTYAQVKQHEKVYLPHQRAISQASVLGVKRQDEENRANFPDYSETDSSKYFEEDCSSSQSRTPDKMIRMSSQQTSISNLTLAVNQHENEIFKPDSLNQNFQAKTFVFPEVAKINNESDLNLNIIYKLFEETNKLQKEIQDTKKMFIDMNQRGNNCHVDLYFNPV